MEDLWGRQAGRKMGRIPRKSWVHGQWIDVCFPRGEG